MPVNANSVNTAVVSSTNNDCRGRNLYLRYFELAPLWVYIYLI